MLEERKARTLDALLVSPATPAHIALGKAACGLFYVLVGAAVTFAASYAVVTHWELALMTTIAAGIFSVSLGLLLGTLLESRQQMQLWTWVVLAPLLISVVFVLMEELMPPVLVSVFRWVPTNLVLNLARAAFAGTITAADWAWQLLALLAAGAATMIAVVWAIRRSDR
jgi:ABC-type Na+ efflux pump permease subunit